MFFIMNMDTLMSVAFGLFVVLFVWRIRERFLESRRKQKELGDANTLRFKPIFYNEDEKNKTSRMRRFISIFLLVFLGGAMIYMIFVSIRDYSTFNEHTIYFRCFLFVITVYSFIRFLYVVKSSNKGHSSK